MKLTHTLQFLAALGLGIGQASGSVQVYYYNGPLSGRVQVALTPGPGYEGAFLADFVTLTETLYYDPVAQTLREVGFVTLTPVSESFEILDCSPSEAEPTEVGSASLTVANNGYVSFNSFAQGSGGVFSRTLVVPIRGSGVYLGQRFTGTWNIEIPLVTQIDTATWTSLTFSQQSYGNGPGQDVVFTNKGDLMDGTSDGTYGWSWDLNAVTAPASPKPAK
jgi:hypothetical protein